MASATANDRPPATCTIIIPVHNKASLTRQCLEVLLGRPAGRTAAEVVVVDDASTDGTAELLAGYGDRIRVVRHATNAGFATACNDGAAAAAGDYLVFLNNDTVPRDGWLDALAGYAAERPGVAAVGAKLLFPDGTIQHAGLAVCHDRHPRHLYLGFPADHPAVNRPRRMQAVTGACLLVRRQAFEEVGGFDTAFVNGYEDVDLCLRLGERGHEIHFCPASVLTHLEAVSRELRSADQKRNVRLYEGRWADRVRPDELEYYVEDGLLRVDHGPTYPVAFTLSPLLAVVSGERPADRLLEARARQVFGLLRDNIRLSVRLLEAERRTPPPDGNGAAPPRVGKAPAVAAARQTLLETAAEDEADLRRLLIEAHERLLRRDEEVMAVVAAALQQKLPGTETLPGHYLPYMLAVHQVREAVHEALPPDATVLVVSRGDDLLLRLGGRRAWHFPQTADGVYAGYNPAGSAEAVAHLEALRAKGADFLLFPSTGLWWLRHYEEFRRHLEERYPVVFRRDDVCVIFALAESRPDSHRGDGRRAGATF